MIYIIIYPCILLILQYKNEMMYCYKNVKIYTAIVIMKNIVAYYQFQK